MKQRQEVPLLVTDLRTLQQVEEGDDVELLVTKVKQGTKLVSVEGEQGRLTIWALRGEVRESSNAKMTKLG
nr:hypothetical protein Iba_chr12eCG6680 [Ipomoea batatas]